MDIYFSQSIIKWTVHPLYKNTTLILERKSVFSYFVWFRYLEIAHSNLWKISFCSGTRNKINSMRYFCVSTCSYNTVLTSFQRNLLLFSLGNLEKTFRNQFVTLNKNKKWFYWIASFNMFIISDRQALETLHLSWVVCGEFKWTYYASYSVALELLLNG